MLYLRNKWYVKSEERDFSHKIYLSKPQSLHDVMMDFIS